MFEFVYASNVRHATFDDSGGKTEGAFIYAGYVAPKAYWDRFNPAWDEALDKCHLPYLHTSEYIQTIPIIGTGSRTDNDAYTILSPFINVIQSHLVRGDGYAVVGLTTSNAWSTLTKEEQKVVRQPSRDCFESAVGLACHSLRSTLSYSDPLAVQVDESNDIAMLAGAYKTLKRDPLYADSLGGICFVDDTKLRSVQAADLLAHLVLRQWRKSKLRQPLDARLVRLISENPERVDNHLLIHDGDALRILAQSRLKKAC